MANSVAGRTAAQIERAKRQAVGGNRKKCIKGKSCSATCIAANKICLVDIPWVAAQTIGPTRDKIMKLSQRPSETNTKLPSKATISPISGRESLADQKRDLNVLIDNINLQKVAGNLNEEGKARLKDLVVARKRALEKEKDPEFIKNRKKLDEEDKRGLQGFNKKIKAADRLIRIEDELIGMYLNRLDKVKPDSTKYKKLQDDIREARKRRKVYMEEVMKLKEAKDVAKNQVSWGALSDPGMNAINKLRDILSELRQFTKVIKIKGSDFAGNLNWNAVEESGARRLGKPGAYGAFIKVPAENLFKFGIKGTYPYGVGVKGGKIGLEETDVLKAVGKAGLGPKLIAAQLSPDFADSSKKTRMGMVAMSIVPGKDLFNFSQHGDKVGSIDVGKAFWQARRDVHKLGIAHNDMHPGNVMIDDRGKVRFVDFGLAQKNKRAAFAEAIGAATGSDWQVNRWEVLGGKEAQNYGAKYAAPSYLKIKENWGRVQRQMESDGLTKAEIASIGATGLRRDKDEFYQGAWANPALTDSRISRYMDMLYDGI